ncbi:MAG: hypothetical protein E5Y02_30025 [Mesorhizobium sp.]|nr:MAG: hypothetical protein E5Y02_30025 [Mesorhizobium sp.]
MAKKSNKGPTLSTATGGETLNAKQAGALLGVGRTRFWQLRVRFGLKRVAWSNDHRPRYRREDVLALRDKVPREDGLIEGSPEWVAEMHRLARQAVIDAGGDLPPD